MIFGSHVILFSTDAADDGGDLGLYQPRHPTMVEGH